MLTWGQMAHRVSSGEEPFIGLVLDRQFRLDAAVGAGSMARVYRAHQLGVGRDVAVKLLRIEQADRAEIAARFRAEAELVARLHHPNVVNVHAVGEFLPPETQAILPYVVLEWLAGRSLAEVLAENPRGLPLARTLHIVLALADALGEAHAHGIVHRDLKPENVMLVRRGDDPDFVKLLDFGLAKALDPRLDPRTRAGSILGTPRYVSPEGAQGLAVSEASDCYGLATLLYQCLAGRTPFEGESAVLLLSLQATAAPPDIRSFEATRSLPEALATVVMQNLEKRPELRARDARAFGRSLVDAARAAGLDAEDFGVSPTLLGTRRRAFAAPTSSREPSVPPPLVNAEDATDSVVSARALRDATRRKARSSRRLGRIALFVACFVVGVAVAAAMASRSDPDARSPAGDTP